MFNHELIRSFENWRTPFYYYDMQQLEITLDLAKREADLYGYYIHYALKANANPPVLNMICNKGFGADCVSGNEVTSALRSGFKADSIVFAGVGKTDHEICTALDNDIFCFNCESVNELEVINELAAQRGKIAGIALRINPGVDSHSHSYITTGRYDNKFGISPSELGEMPALLTSLTSLKLIGLHFHIGSQITDMNVFRELCLKVNELQDFFNSRGIDLQHLNLGGGLGIDYNQPASVANFSSYFKAFADNLKVRPGQKVHFELGRSLVAPCGILITKALFVKKGMNNNFVVVDAGMTDLIRPALYGSFHSIENLSSDAPLVLYDIVGPICETSDCFAKDRELPETKRGDILAVKSAGAYGQVMASQYNQRNLAEAYYSENKY